MSVDFELYGNEDDSTTALYAAARQRSPISAMFQLGEQPGQLFGAFMKSVAAGDARIRRLRNTCSMAFLGLPGPR